MNTGQTLLSIFALVLLGTTIITVNRMYTQHGTVLEHTEIGIYATSLAMSIVEEASGQHFDDATVADAVTTTSSLTTPASLGPEAGETTVPASTTLFNDFDDYNNLTMGVRVAGIDSFTVKASVYYINDTLPAVKSTTRTWFKRMDVSVFGSATSDTIKTSYIFSYFNFR